MVGFFFLGGGGNSFLPVIKFKFYDKITNANRFNTASSHNVYTRSSLAKNIRFHKPIISTYLLY